MASRRCAIEACERPYSSRGWCRMHYCRWQRTGDPHGRPQYGSITERFWSKVDKDGPVPDVFWDHELQLYRIQPQVGPCSLWTGSQNGSGYGQFWVEGSTMTCAHRVGWELVNGPIPAGLAIDHLCRVTLCVRATHLEPVTVQENLRRTRWATCKAGHDLTDPGTVFVRGDGSRTCRPCRDRRNAERVRKAA